MKEHRKMQRQFKEEEVPSRYKIRIQKFLKGPMDTSLSQVRLSKLSDMEKVQIFRSMLERVFQETDRQENMYEDIDTYCNVNNANGRSHKGSRKNNTDEEQKRHYMQVTLNEVFSIRKLEKLFIMIARHCCFYACIKMDFMVKSIMCESADFLVESLIFDWMMSKLGGVKGWAQVYEMEKEINAGRAKPPSKHKGNDNRIYGTAANSRAQSRQQASGAYAEFSSNQPYGDHVKATRGGAQMAANEKYNSRNNPQNCEKVKSTGCSCVIM